MSYLLVVEDSEMDRALIQRVIGKSHSNLELVFAVDPFEAREMISQRKPAALLLDLSLPNLSGPEFLVALMRSFPLPVFVMTGDSRIAGAPTERLIEMGAISVFEKSDLYDGCSRFEDQLSNAIEETVSAQNCRVGPGQRGDDRSVGQCISPGGTSFSVVASVQNQIDAVAIGSSTGGPQALQQVLSALPANCPPVIIAQHISEPYVSSLVERLNAHSDLNVVVAPDDVRLQRGYAYVASPHAHLEITGRWRTKYVNKDKLDPYSPSVNRLFLSLAETQPRRVIACVLTGMGNDGAEGLLELRKRGGRTIAQDESTSAVFGMPARAVDCGAAEEILPIDDIPACVLRWCLGERDTLVLGDA